VNAILLKHSAQSVVAADLALVARLLEIVLLDVFPDFLDALGP
jgi:hypothetical protein